MSSVREGQKAEQKAELLAAVRAQPGQTAYQLGPAVTVPQPEDTLLSALFDMPPAAAPLRLVLALLQELERDGVLYSQAWPSGARWYPVPGPEQEQQA